VKQQYAIPETAGRGMRDLQNEPIEESRYATFER
jgi:hypothetical protein